MDAILHVTRNHTARGAARARSTTSGPPSTSGERQRPVHLRGAGPQARTALTGGDRGWIGDNPFILLETRKILATGWKPKLTIEQGIIRTLRWLESNRWVYEARH